MRIAIAGIGGFVGSRLKTGFLERGDTIVGIDRSDFAKGTDHIASLLDGCETIVNLSGAPIIARWSDEYKKILASSRIGTTAMLVDACASLSRKPACLISTSAVGIYRGDGIYDETVGQLSDDFLGRLCREWEAQAWRAAGFGIRVCITRFGIVVGPNGGALGTMLPVFRWGLGGPIGSGRQGFSWIHVDDLARAVERMADDRAMSGIYNLVAPNPSTNAGLTRALASALHRPAVIPVPLFLLHMVYGEGATVLADGQRVVPRRLLESGFSFLYPTLDEAVVASVS